MVPHNVDSAARGRLVNVPWPRMMPALITPFDTTAEVDLSAHRHNVGVAQRQGAKGILIAGSTGEGPYLEPGERAALVEAARAISSDLVVLCGIFAESDREARSQIIEAADNGADAVLVVTPTTLIRGRDTAVFDYFTRIARFSPVPVLLYTVPPVTGYELPVHTIAELAAHDNVRGIKDSGGVPSRIAALEPILNDRFVVYAGNSAALLESGQLGAHGAITASANYAAETVDRSVGGDERAQADLNAITSVVQRFGVAGTKFAASLGGMRVGASRLPILPLDAAAEESIKTAFHDWSTQAVPSN